MKKILIIPILSIFLIVGFVNAVSIGYCEQDNDCVTIPSGCCQECNENNEVINLQAVNLHDRDEWREDCESKGILCTAQACELGYITLCKFNRCELIPLNEETPEIHKLEPGPIIDDCLIACPDGITVLCGEECPKEERCSSLGKYKSSENRCCEGLVPIPPKNAFAISSSTDSCSIMKGFGLICASCGDKVCDYTYEGECNCPQDCEEMLPSETITIENDIENYRFIKAYKIIDAGVTMHTAEYSLSDKISTAEIIEFLTEAGAIAYIHRGDMKNIKEKLGNNNLLYEVEEHVFWKNKNLIIGISGPDKEAPIELIIEYLKKYPSDIPLSESNCDGCLYEDLCVPFGTGKEGKYCDITKEFLPKKKQEGTCDNNYECLSNECSDSKCISTYNLLEKIWNWLKELF